MQFAKIGTEIIRYRVSGDTRGPVIAFANSLGTDLTIWDAVIDRLPRGYAIVCYDKRGHGLSSMHDQPRSIRDHANDLLGLLDHVGAQHFFVCGVSVGGMIAQQLAVQAPQRVDGLILCNTGAKIGSDEIWNARIEAINRDGHLANAADGILERWFSTDFHATNAAEVAGYKRMLIQTPASGYTATCAAIRDTDLTEMTRTLSVPTLCVAGDQDKSTTPELVKSLADLIDDAAYHEISPCGHIPSIEQPEMLAGLICEFLDRADTFSRSFTEPRQPLQDVGTGMRCKVLGHAHVERATQNISEFDRDFQSFITEGAWGRVWSGRHFSLRERSLVTIALLAGIGQDEELALHIRAAQNTGASEDDIKEVLMHVAVYAGVPRANHAIKIAKGIFNEKRGSA